MKVKNWTDRFSFWPLSPAVSVYCDYGEIPFSGKKAGHGHYSDSDRSVNITDF